MSTDAERLALEAMSLPAAQRAELAHRLIASLDEEEESDAAPTDAAGAAEAQRRLREIERGEITAISQEELFDRVRRRLAR